MTLRKGWIQLDSTNARLSLRKLRTSKLGVIGSKWVSQEVVLQQRILLDKGLSLSARQHSTENIRSLQGTYRLLAGKGKLLVLIANIWKFK